jgi:YD repeat-containing protein
MVSTVDTKGQTITSTYDALNRPTSQSFAGGADITITYDQGTKAIGHLSRITNREGTVAFTYDQQGRIGQERRTLGAITHTTGYSWDAATRDLAAMTYPSGLTVANTRDTNGRITAIRNGVTSCVLIFSPMPRANVEVVGGAQRTPV